MNNSTKGSLIAAAALYLLCMQLNAAIIGVAEGTAAPGATLGPFGMTPFTADAQPNNSPVSAVSSPVSGSVDFSSTLHHFIVGAGWGSWSHGYSGDVYWTLGQTSVGLTLPANTQAFYFYAEPNPLATFQITAVAHDGTTLTQTVSGDAGAAGYGFYGTAGDLLQSVTVTSTTDFAVGEFGIAQAPSGPVEPPPSGGGGESVPDDGHWAMTLAAACLGGTNLLWRRRTA